MPYKNLCFSAIIIALVITNDAVWHSLAIGLLFGLGYILWHGYLLGRSLFKRENLSLQILIGSFLILILISILGTAFYYFYKITPLIINFIIILISLLVFSLKFNIPHQVYKIPISSLILFSNKIIKVYFQIKNFFWQLRYQKKKLFWDISRDTALIAAYILLTLINWVTIFKGITTETVNSLWDTLSPQFLFSYFLATVIIILISVTKKHETINLFLARAHIFLTLALAVVIYKIGYGFDPFIHRATENVIAAQGFITPKTPYYIGQYSLVVILAQLLQLSISTVDKFLLPILYSFFIPAFIYVVYRRLARPDWIVVNQENNPQPVYYLLPLILLIIPFSDFIVTTPQGLANLLALIIIIASTLLISKKINYYFSYLLIFLSVAALLTHPLTGIPIFLFSVFTFLISYNFKNYHWQKTFIILLVALTVLTLPLSFAIQSVISPDLANPLTLTKLNWDVFKEIIQPISPIWSNKFNVVQDYFHFLGNNIRWILIILAGFGYYFLRFKKQEKRYNIYPLFFILMLTTYVLLRIFISWRSVIFYEENDYPLRILNLSFYFLIPLILQTAIELTKKLFQQKLPTKLFFTVLLALTITSVLYVSYPFDDAYQTSHYYSVSQNDIQAVNYINNNADGDYIVLANQSVSAAALQQFGFKKYFSTYQGETFYYPIPTSSPLYHYYLTTVYQAPTRQTINKAMDFMRVSQAYFVINSYWTDFDKIVSTIKTEADDWKDINNGKIYIFYFKK
jgi:hypothetical protein